MHSALTVFEDDTQLLRELRTP